MTANSKRTGAGRERDSAEPDPGAPQTPSTDMQDEDTGTAASGNEDRGTAAERAMKQTSKTGREEDRKR